MDNLSKQSWLRGMLYFILQNVILIGMPFVPICYYWNIFSLKRTVLVDMYSSFSGGIMLYRLSTRVFEETGSHETVAMFQLRYLIVKVVIFNLLFLLVIMKKRFVYGSVFLNTALAFWGLAVGLWTVILIA